MIQKDLSEALFFSHNMSINIAYNNNYTNFPNHWHGCQEIIISLSDQMEITIDTESYALKKNQFALIPPRKLHSITKMGHGPLFIIQFTNDFLPRLNDYTANRHLFYFQKIICNQDFSEYKETPIDILYNIKNYFYSSIQFKEFLMYQELLKLFIMIGEYNSKLYHLSSPNKLRKRIHPTILHSITMYIAENCTNEISLEEVASFAGFSKYHFSRIFKEYFDTSFPEYIMKQRIYHAIELLENPDISILNAALSAGFTSHSSFNRTFKQVMNCTPSSFRKMFNKSLL